MEKNQEFEMNPGIWTPQIMEVHFIMAKLTKEQKVEIFGNKMGLWFVKFMNRKNRQRKIFEHNVSE